MHDIVATGRITLAGDRAGSFGRRLVPYHTTYSALSAAVGGCGAFPSSLGKPRVAGSGAEADDNSVSTSRTPPLISSGDNSSSLACAINCSICCASGRLSRRASSSARCSRLRASLWSPSFARCKSVIARFARPTSSSSTSPSSSYDRQLLLAADFQRLVELTARLQDVGDPAHRHGARAHVAEALVDRQLLLVADSQRLVELRRGPAGCRRSGPSSRRARARRRAAHRPAAPPRGGSSAPRRLRRGPAGCRRSGPSSRRASARRRAAHRPAAAPRGGFAAPRRVAPRACRMSAIWPIVTARERTSPRRS